MIALLRLSFLAEIASSEAQRLSAYAANCEGASMWKLSSLIDRWHPEKNNLSIVRDSNLSFSVVADIAAKDVVCDFHRLQVVLRELLANLGFWKDRLNKRSDLESRRVRQLSKVRRYLCTGQPPSRLNRH
jgi:hypothetical protein